MEEEIRTAYGKAKIHRNHVYSWQDIIRAEEETAISDLGEEYASAKNNDVRKQLVRDRLADNEEYQKAVTRLRHSEISYELARMDIEMLKDVARVRALS